jgi:hypothetical protein
MVGGIPRQTKEDLCESPEILFRFGNLSNSSPIKPGSGVRNLNKKIGQISKAIFLISSVDKPLTIQVQDKHGVIDKSDSCNRLANRLHEEENPRLLILGGPSTSGKG